MKVTMPGRPPDFIGLGVHRSGSTWLTGQLQQHPDVWTPPQVFKEVHYFDELYIPEHRRWHDGRIPTLGALIKELLPKNATLDDLTNAQRVGELATSERDDDWYRSVFGLAPDNALSVGEITPAYSMLDTAGLEHIKRVNPKVRLLIILRDPAERVWSHMKLRLKAEIAADPSILQDEERIRPLTVRPGVANRTQYRQMIERVRQVFTPDQIYVSFFERVAEQPHELLTEVAQHIGVDPVTLPFENIGKRRHTSASADLPDWLRLWAKETFSADIQWLAQEYGSYASRWFNDYEQLSIGSVVE